MSMARPGFPWNTGPRLSLRSSNTCLERPVSRYVSIACLLIGLLIGCLLEPAYAMDPNRAMSQYLRDRWGPENGFPKGPATVTTMCRSEKGSVVLWVLQDEARAVEHRGEKFELLATQTGMSRSPVLSMTQMPNGELWLGTRDAGLFRLSQGQTSAVTDGLPDRKVNCLLRDREHLWVGTDNGIAFWDGRELIQSGVPATLRSTRILAMARDRDSNLWVGTNDRGLLRLNNQGVSSFARCNS